MEKDDLKCILIGRDIMLYQNLAKLVRKLDSSSRFTQINAVEDDVKTALQKISGPCLLFIYDEVPFSLEKLSDLVWQNNADSSVVIVTKKSRTISTSTPFNSTQFSRVKFDEVSTESETSLKFIIQAHRDNVKLNRCKHLLGTAEKRCQWLVDSSSEAVAFISRDMHWHANKAYLRLFNIGSAAELRTITVKDLILPSEHNIFDGFVRENSRLVDTKNALTLSMKKHNGSVFRSQVYLIPSVFKGQKCYQLWVKKINVFEKEPQDSNDDVTIENHSDSVGKPTVNVPDDVVVQDQSTRLFTDASWKEKEVDTTKPQQKSEPQLDINTKLLLADLLESSETTIMADKLSYLQVTKGKGSDLADHQLLSLKVTESRKNDVDEVLLSQESPLSKDQISVFWDRVKFLKLQKTLIKRKKLKSMMVVRINQASIKDNQFMRWLKHSVLQSLEGKSPNVTLLLPVNSKGIESETITTLIEEIKSFGCHVGFDNFTSAKQSIELLRASKPKYVRLSRNWVNDIQDNEIYEKRLSNLIKQLEENAVQVIAPCSFNKDMRLFYVKAGASFCQEIPTEIG